MELHTLIPAVLAYLTPSEQAMYLRLWHLSRGEGTCAVRYDDLAHSAHISRSTLKRVLKILGDCVELDTSTKTTRFRARWTTAIVQHWPKIHQKHPRGPSTSLWCQVTHSRQILTRRKLITVTLQAKRASLFAIFERPLSTKKISLGFDRPRL
jgi:hypothetical protein